MVARPTRTSSLRSRRPATTSRTFATSAGCRSSDALSRRADQLAGGGFLLLGFHGHDPLLEPRVLALEDPLRQPEQRTVRWAEEVAEVVGDAKLRLTAEHVREIDRIRVAVLCDLHRVHARRRHRKQLGADVDGA